MITQIIKNITIKSTTHALELAEHTECGGGQNGK